MGGAGTSSAPLIIAPDDHPTGLGDSCIPFALLSSPNFEAGSVAGLGPFLFWAAAAAIAAIPPGGMAGGAGDGGAGRSPEGDWRIRQWRQRRAASRRPGSRGPGEGSSSAFQRGLQARGSAGSGCVLGTG